MNGAVKQCLLAFNEASQNLPMRRTEPFVYSMDSDSAQLGPSGRFELLHIALVRLHVVPPGIGRVVGRGVLPAFRKQTEMYLEEVK